MEKSFSSPISCNPCLTRTFAESTRFENVLLSAIVSNRRGGDWKCTCFLSPVFVSIFVLPEIYVVQGSCHMWLMTVIPAFSNIFLLSDTFLSIGKHMHTYVYMYLQQLLCEPVTFLLNICKISVGLETISCIWIGGHRPRGQNAS